jgi:hypothetical protein
MIGSADEFRRLRLSDSPDEYGRAAHEPAAAGVWHEVITRYPDLRIWVAHNKTVPLEILEILARDAEASVRVLVAMKRKLSSHLFEQLATDEDASVRHAIAQNARTPERLLVQLSSDGESFVAEAANERLRK